MPIIPRIVLYVGIAKLNSVALANKPPTTLVLHVRNLKSTQI